jgi:hypothetical protein
MTPERSFRSCVAIHQIKTATFDLLPEEFTAKYTKTLS